MVGNLSLGYLKLEARIPRTSIRTRKSATPARDMTKRGR